MSPSEKLKKPIIGTITAQLAGEVSQGGKTRQVAFPEDSYEVIDIVNTKSGEQVYVCNEWYKPGIPQLVPASMVKNFTKKVS